MYWLITLTLGLLSGTLHTQAQQGYASGSYSRMKQHAEQAALPKPAELRVEEFYNYHRHDMPLPAPGEDLRLSAYASPRNESGYTTLHIGLTTAAEAGEFSRASLSLVVDRSGSMDGDKIAKTKAALRSFVMQLSPEDRVALVLFDHLVETTFPCQPIADKRALLRAIDAIEVRGSTDLNGGIIEGYRQQLRYFSPGYAHRVIVITDFLANTGVMDPAQIVANTAEYDARKEIDYVLIGVGSDFSPEMAQKMAVSKRTALHFMHDAADIEKVFVQEAATLRAPVGHDAVLEIEARDLQSFSLLGYEGQARIENGRLLLPLNTLNAGLTQQVLLSIPAQASGPLRAVLRYTRSGTKESGLVQASWHLNGKGRLLDADMPAAEAVKTWHIARLAAALHEMARLYHDQHREKQAGASIEAAIWELEQSPALLEDADINRMLDIARRYVTAWRIAEKG